MKSAKDLKTVDECKFGWVSLGALSDRGVVMITDFIKKDDSVYDFVIFKSKSSSCYHLKILSANLLSFGMRLERFISSNMFSVFESLI